MYLYDDFYYYETGHLVEIQYLMNNNSVEVNDNNYVNDNKNTLISSKEQNLTTKNNTNLSHMLEYDISFLLFTMLLFFTYCLFFFLKTLTFLLKKKKSIQSIQDPLNNCNNLIVMIGDDIDLCSICLSNFENNEKIVELPCKHKYHENCIKPWLENTRVCPLCRDNV